MYTILKRELKTINRMGKSSTTLEPPRYESWSVFFPIDPPGVELDFQSIVGKLKLSGKSNLHNWQTKPLR